MTHPIDALSNARSKIVILIAVAEAVEKRMEQTNIDADEVIAALIYENLRRLEELHRELDDNMDDADAPEEALS